MFENLSDKILTGIKKIRGQGRISEANIEETLRDIRVALLEADVNFKVVKDFITHVKEKAIGAEVLKSLEPGQVFVKIVQDELTALMGGSNQALDLGGHPPTVVMLVGLQGAGKTTTCGKLSKLISKSGRRPLLVSLDVYRPAAIDQLKTLGEKNKLPVFDTQPNQKPREILKNAKAFAAQNGHDILILDTAGRLQIDDALMTELEDLKKESAPREILLVADAMTGQDAVTVAQGFHDRLGLTGLILTKLDGDARGGAALSIKAATGTPIKFVGVSEKMDGLEPFHPDRMAQRILDMGDIASLVEKASEVMEADKAQEQLKKLRKNQFTLEDFMAQLRQIKKMGPMEGILKMIPGMGQASKQLKDMTPPDDELRKIEAIISSMTPAERENYKILNGSRRSRIARGSGTQVSDINRFIRQFEQMQKMMKMFSRGFGGMGRPF